MATVIENGTDKNADDIEALLAGLESPVVLSDDEVVEGVVAGLEAGDVIEEMVADAPIEASVEAALPIESAPVEKPAKAKREKKAKAEKPADDTPKTPKVYYGKDKGRRIADKLGDGLGGAMTLEPGESAEQVVANLAAFEALNQKVKNRATNFIETVAGKSKLAGVHQLVVGALMKDGALHTGDEGNVHKVLLAHPYSPAAARAMGNNTVAALKMLKVVVAGEKRGEYVPNPNSLYFKALKG